MLGTAGGSGIWGRLSSLCRLHIILNEPDVCQRDELVDRNVATFRIMRVHQHLRIIQKLPSRNLRLSDHFSAEVSTTFRLTSWTLSLYFGCARLSSALFLRSTSSASM
ncbi:hypothetical protein VNO80_01188 [Phaseolus coccineus]|uniref:Uncharacterized protein n=1 Tax=Phaseolus coccineus TaxID=3886 RepID=A0AAN9RRE1_PHACN